MSDRAACHDAARRVATSAMDRDRHDGRDLDGSARAHENASTTCCSPVAAGSRLSGRSTWADRPGRFRLSSFRSEEHTSELQSLMRISYAVFCLKKKKKHKI